MFRVTLLTGDQARLCIQAQYPIGCGAGNEQRLAIRSRGQRGGRQIRGGGGRGEDADSDNWPDLKLSQTC